MRSWFGYGLALSGAAFAAVVQSAAANAASNNNQNPTNASQQSGASQQQGQAMSQPSRDLAPRVMLVFTFEIALVVMLWQRIEEVLAGRDHTFITITHIN